MAGSSTRSPPAVETQIEVDETLDHRDFDEQISTFTESLSSSVVDYPVEHGRRYHAYRAGSYVFPNDERELGRLDMVHIMLTRSIGDRLYLAPIETDKVHKVLDIGTGTGVWAIEIADEIPNAEILGNDLSPVQPTWTPPNLKFEVDDVESEWTYDFKFDFIFCRHMAASIGDWPKLFRNIYENLSPGSWAEFQDLDLTYTSDDGSLTSEHFTQKWATTITDFLEKIGRDPKPGKRLRGLAEETGFENIQERIIRLPIGPWPRDPKLKELGMINVVQLLDALEGVSSKPLALCGYTPDEATVLVAKVREELKARTFHGYYTYHVVYGQKPS